MKAFLDTFQVITGILLIVAILLQSKGQGFARSQNPSSFTRRGAERLVFRGTFVLTAVFILVSILQLFVR